MKNKIAEFRKKSKYTQMQIAEKLNIGTRLFQSYEYGTVIPSVIIALKIAKVLNTTVEELYSDEE